MKRGIILMALLLASCKDWLLHEGEIIWSIPLRGPIYSVPSYHAGVIYVGSDWNRLFAIDVSGYPIYWQRVHGDFRGAPVVWEDASVVAVDWWDNMYAYDREGNELWRKTEGSWNWYPALEGDTVLAVYYEWDWILKRIDKDGRVVREDTLPSGWSAEFSNVVVDSSGRVIVSSPLSDILIEVKESGEAYVKIPKIISHASTDGRSLYFVTATSSGTFLEKTRGLWRRVKILDFPLRDWEAAQPLIDGKGRVIVATDRGLYVFTESLYPLWSYPLPSCHTFGSCGFGTPTPAVGESGNIYFACGSNLMAVSESGELLWYLDLSEDTVKVEDYPADITGILLIDRRLIVTSCNGKIYSIYVKDTYDHDAPWPMFQHDPRRTGSVRSRK